MRGTLALGTMAIAAAAIAGHASLVLAGSEEGDETICDASVGPDLIVGEIQYTIANYESLNGIEAFAIGTTACNVGSEEVMWVEDTPEHPVITQSMFRMKNGRFEQVGQAWLKHGFTATTGELCCFCTPSGDEERLGVGCSDPYTAGRNGAQHNLGPKYEVNGFTGAFAYPPDDPFYYGPVERRLQVKISDIDPAQDGGGLYFVESQYVSADDSAAGNQNNNASYRAIGVHGGGDEWTMSMSGMPQTVREAPAIRAWKHHDPNVVESDVQIPGEGLLIVSALVTDLGTGWHRYEYAVQNLNSDRAVGTFRVPMNVGSIVDNVGFHDVEYHSGEIYDTADWSWSLESDAIVWTTASFEESPEANALRWGTLYNFRFDTTAPPVTGDVTFGLFKPGSPDAVFATSVTPDPGPADCNLNGMPDLVDIALGYSRDCDANLIPDDCQPDCDGDGLPDSCEIDADSDDVPNDCDNCPISDNPDQDDLDGDGIGNACDADFCVDAVFADDFEIHKGWFTQVDGATRGLWERSYPVNDPNWPHDPESDSDGSGRCYLTENATGWSDVDGGAVILYTPLLNMLIGPVTISYDYYLSLSRDDGFDRMLVEISSNSLDGPWTEIALHQDDMGTAWTTNVITQADLEDAGVALTNLMLMRFTVNDGDIDSAVEAGIDAFSLTTNTCFVDCNRNFVHDLMDIYNGSSDDANGNGVPDECECAGDLDGDLIVGFSDLLSLLFAWGPCGDCPQDLDGNGAVDFQDLLQVLFAWGPCS